MRVAWPPFLYNLPCPIWNTFVIDLVRPPVIRFCYDDETTVSYRIVIDDIETGAIDVNSISGAQQSLFRVFNLHGGEIRETLEYDRGCIESPLQIDVIGGNICSFTFHIVQDGMIQMVLGESTSQGILIREIDILNELKGTPAPHTKIMIKWYLFNSNDYCIFHYEGGTVKIAEWEPQLNVQPWGTSKTITGWRLAYTVYPLRSRVRQSHRRNRIQLRMDVRDQ